jgi:hypothetical protein
MAKAHTANERNGVSPSSACLVRGVLGVVLGNKLGVRFENFQAPWRFLHSAKDTLTLLFGRGETRQARICTGWHRTHLGRVHLLVLR